MSETQNAFKNTFKHTAFFSLQGYISTKDISMLFLQISTMLQSHLPLLHIIQICADNAKNTRLKEILQDIAYHLQLGQNLSFGFKKYRNVFGDMSYQMITLGEKSGELKEIFSMLSSHLTKEYKNKNKLKRTLFYPILVFLSIMGAFMVLVAFVLPQFLEMFLSMQIELPIYTRILLFMQTFFIDFGLIFALCVLCAVALFGYAYKNTLHFKAKIHAYILHIPLVGAIIKAHFYYQYSFSLYIQLKSATPMDLALALSKDISNLALKAKFESALESVKNGKALSVSLKEQNALDDIALALINAGEQSGNLAEMLEVCAKHFEEIATEKTDMLISLIEPSLSLTMGILLLFLALGIFVPMWDMSVYAFGA
ncbi:putative type II secretion system protein [Helicobacter cinaedi PAGU611]|nr:type II secretion system F family protein [Helicobacter cinaedi]AWK62643.1 type II secretion system F family protein [Helicobacter cinaedi]QOQ90551.1 type II secretion system F family protein [Helicobacter cinaedi]QOQ96720.1 type II secretion system F family protein [Helicobacter cinaedi]BAM13232.1 putative type II secretion system protein [Helicobacter cinaedi PAGU611]BAM33577.1 putative type II secretion system protein [Helicobacter cinaedi CCUG 18818 = ATCC BAA-847]